MATMSKTAAERAAHEDVVNAQGRAKTAAEITIEEASSRAQSAIDEASARTTLAYMDVRQNAVKLRASASTGVAATVEGGRTYLQEVGEASRTFATTYAANTGSTLKAAIKFQSVMLSPGLLLLDAGSEGGRNLGQQLNKAAQQLQTTTREAVQRAQRALDNFATPESNAVVIATDTTTVEVVADAAIVAPHPSRKARKN